MTKQTPMDLAEAASRSVAGELRAELARQRRTAADLALVLGTTPHTAGKRLNGQSPFTIVELAQATAWLGVSLHALVERAEAQAAVPDSAVA